MGNSDALEPNGTYIERAAVKKMEILFIDLPTSVGSLGFF